MLSLPEQRISRGLSSQAAWLALSTITFMEARLSTSTSSPALLWSPPSDVRETTVIGRYLRWLADERALEFSDYEALWRWSITDLDGFWTSIWDFFHVRAHSPYSRVREGADIASTRWFTGATLNYAEHLLPDDTSNEDRTAIIAHSQTRPPLELTVADLRAQVARVRTGLRALGVGPGDRVAAYLPNIPEAVVAFIATASLGAIWSSCAPEFGARSVIDRFAQIEPKVLFAVSGYGFRDRHVERREHLAAIRRGLPTVDHVIGVPYGPDPVPDAVSWHEIIADASPLSFEPVAFDHPLYILFSSGTTGLPKAIVHGHGGMLLEHLKAQGLSWNLGPNSRLLQFTTTAWMMWNVLVSALLLQASIVLLDGDPTWPSLRYQWELAAETKTTLMGTSPAFVMACRKDGVQLGNIGLEKLATVFTAGSPLPADGYRYLYEQLGGDLLLINGSGGTDVCTALVSGSPLQPVYEGEISGPCLGVDVQALDEHGQPVIGQPGEMVIAQPMPSMPIGFWSDPDDARYRASYFEDIPGFWRQGDWITFTERGSCIITGRSDATLNRAGVRLGTGEMYSVVEERLDIADSLVVHLEDADGGPGELLLFVTPAPGHMIDADAEQAIRASLRTELSPRHVPDQIVYVPAIPRTLTGKKLEAPVKKILRGAAPDAVASRDALVDPSALEAFVDYAKTRRELASRLDGRGDPLASQATSTKS
jgi:acetoacetyl-CoA synthetase